MITVLDEEVINAEGGDFFGRDRYEAREAILDQLREMGDLEGERSHQMVVGHCERCGTSSSRASSGRRSVRRPCRARARIGPRGQ